MFNNVEGHSPINDKLESEPKSEDDTLCDVSSSGTFDKYSSEFESVTDDDIGKILEKMNKLADTVSSSSASNCVNFEYSSNNSTQEEKSLEELLEEAEQLVRKNISCMSEKILKSDIDSDCDIIANIDGDIFQRIEEEVRKESEKNKNCTEFSRNKELHNQTANSSITSFADDVIERDTSSRLKNKEKARLDLETALPLKLSFKSDEINSLNSNCTLSDISKIVDENVNLNKSHFQTDNISTKRTEDVLCDVENLKEVNELVESKIDNSFHELIPSKAEDIRNGLCVKHIKQSEQSASNILDSNTKSNKLEISGKSTHSNEFDSSNDMYKVELTPRLELFADTITKLKVEKANENPVMQKHEEVNNEKRNSLQDNSKETLQESNLIETNDNSRNNVAETKHENSSNLVQKGSKIVNNCKPISRPVTNHQLISASEKFLKIVHQRKQPFQKLKALSKNNSTKVKPLLKHKREKSCLAKKQSDLKKQSCKLQMKSVRLSSKQELSVTKKQNVSSNKVSKFCTENKKSEVSLKQNIGSPSDRQEDKKRITLPLESPKNKFIENSENIQHEVKIMPTELNKLQQQTDHIKELQEEMYKLNLEVADLKEQNLDYLLKNENVNQQNSLLKDELKMFKDQLKEKNNFIAERLQTLAATELKLRKQIEHLKVDLNTKTESLKLTKLNYERLEKPMLLLEKELLELRVKEGNLQEKLGVARNHAEREKQLSLKLKNQVILDSNKIMDLTRQVRELERIINRKDSGSVSALLFSANSEQDKLNLEKIKLLEIRNRTLEEEIKAKEEAAQQRLSDFRKEFADMKKKYTLQIVDLENKLLSTLSKENYTDMSTQTVYSNDKSRRFETLEEHGSGQITECYDEKEPRKLTKVDSLKLQNKKQDAHFISSVCKLKLELANKNKALTKLSKELQQLQEANRRLRREHEKKLHEVCADFKNVDSNKKGNPSLISLDKGFLSCKSSDINYDNSNASLIQREWRSQDVSSVTTKFYNPLQYSEDYGGSVVKNLRTENTILKEELSKIKGDFSALKSKRLCDLNLLQEEHERELAALIQKYNVKEEELNVLKLERRSSPRKIPDERVERSSSS